MVSTRGTKLKFNKGEKVLCYETDPNKTKLLFESKILDIIFTKDETNTKLEQYFIHFIGWKNSYDRYVTEEKILPDNEENRKLQKQLYEKAALLSSNRKRKSVSTGKGLLNKKAGEKDVKRQKRNSSSDSDSDEENEQFERDIKISIPDSLKKILEEDYYNINDKNMLVFLPAESNVSTILDKFLKHYSQSLISSNGCKPSDPISLPSALQKRIQICKEVMEGIKTLFDFSLSNILLYNKEKDQHAKQFSPSSSKRDSVTPSPTKGVKNKLPPKTLRTRAGMKKNTINNTPEETKKINKPSSSSSNIVTPVTDCGVQPSVDPALQNPSLIYGAHHLLRLLVKLPEVLQNMDIRPSRLALIDFYVQNFIHYLEEGIENTFCSTVYKPNKDAVDTAHDGK